MYASTINKLQENDKNININFADCKDESDEVYIPVTNEENF